MKKILFLFFAMSAALPAFCQSSSDDDLAMIQTAYGKDKRALVKDYMALDAQKAKLFQPLYESYEVQRRALAKERAEILKSYVVRYNTLEDHLASALAERTLNNDAKYTNLYRQYLKKIGKAIGGQDAAKFLQLEVYLQNSIRNAILNNLPFIGELEQHRRPLDTNQQ